MKILITFFLLSLPFVAATQQLNYAPYNPDSNTDGIIGTQDLLDFLLAYGSYWYNYADDVNSLNEIQILELHGDTLTLRPNAELLLADVFGLEITDLTEQNIDSILAPYTSKVIISSSGQVPEPSWNEESIDDLLPTGCYTLFKKVSSSPSVKRIIGEFDGYIFYMSYSGQIIKLSPDGSWLVIWEVPFPQDASFINNDWYSQIDSNQVLFLGLTSGFQSHILNLSDNSIESATYDLPYSTQIDYTHHRFKSPWFYAYASDGTFDGGWYFYNTETGYFIENPWVSNYVTNQSFQFTSDNTVGRFLDNGNFQKFNILTGQLSTTYFSSPKPNLWASWNDSLITIHSTPNGSEFDLNIYNLPATTPSLSETWYQIETDETNMELKEGATWNNIIEFNGGGTFYRNGSTAHLSGTTFYMPYTDSFELSCRPFGAGVYYGNSCIVTNIFVDGLSSLLGASYWAFYDF